MTAQDHLDGKFNQDCPHTKEEWVMKVNEIDAWVMERFGKNHTWTLLWGGLTPDEEDKVYYRIQDLYVLEEDGTSTQGIAILWEEKSDETDYRHEWKTAPLSSAHQTGRQERS